MRKNSWLSQWGILTIWGIPCLLRGSQKEALAGILISCVMALVTTLWFGRKKESVFGVKHFFLRRANEIPVAKGWLKYRGIKKMIRKIFFCIAGLILSVNGIVKVALWYSEAVQNAWVILGMLLFVLILARRCNGAGKRAMENLWGKVVLVCVLALFIFQIPALWEMREAFSMSLTGKSVPSGDDFEFLKAVQYGIEVFLLTLPALYMEICLKKSQDSENERERMLSGTLFFRWGSLWLGFFAVYLCLTALWNVQILKMAPFPYLLLGQTSKTFSGQGVRLETLNFMVIIVSLYFAAIQCMDVFRSWAGEYMSKEKRRIRGAKRHLTTPLILCAIIFSGVTCAGCSAKLGEKKLVLIGDENQVADRNFDTEFSCMQFLVLHTKTFEEVAKAVLNQPNISYETYVAFSEKPIEEDMGRLMEEVDSAKAMKIVEELVEKGTKTGEYEYVTIREFLNACAKNETVMLPVLEISDGEIRLQGFVEYKKTGKND